MDDTNYNRNHNDDDGEEDKNVKHSPWFELECIVTTCLYLASKVEDTARRVSDVCNVVRRCRLRLQKEAGGRRS